MPKEIDSDAELQRQLSQQARGAFWRAAKIGFFCLVEEAPAAWKGSDARLYRAEKNMITEHLEPFYWGAFVTVFLFGTFRVSGSRWYTRFRENATTNFNQRNNSHLTNSASAGKLQHKKPPEWESYLDQRAEKGKYIREEAFRLPTDLLVSLMCGASSIVWLSSPSQLKKDLTEAPLAPGKSIIYECLCSDMEASFSGQVDPRVLANECNGDDTLITFQTLVQNCRIRSDYIRDKERDGCKMPDVIPYPGLEGVRR